MSHCVMKPRLDCHTPICGLGQKEIVDFWSWAYSDVVSNGVRSVFAEYLVAEALGVTSGARVEWDAVDLRYGGVGIEVKASGYVQSWVQNGPSRIVFDIKQRLPWDAATNTLGACLQRSADCYVFCVHTARCREECRVLDVSQWEFYVVGKTALEAAFGAQKSVALSRIQLLCRAGSHGPVGFDGIRSAIDVVTGRESESGANPDRAVLVPGIGGGDLS